MKSKFLILNLILTMSSLCLAQESTKLTIELHGLKSDKGQLMIALYDDDETWLNKAFMNESAEIVDGKAVVIFKDVPHGEYAISSFHDENDNGKLDTGIFGIPKEPYACSNGARGRFGPPKWNDADFSTTNTSQTIVIEF